MPAASGPKQASSPSLAHGDLDEPLVGEVRGEFGDVRFRPVLGLGGVGQDGIDERHAQTL